MKRAVMLCCLLVAGLLSVSPALADTFDFTFSGPLYSGSTVITADLTASPGAYDITAISGSVTPLGGSAVAINGLLAPGTFDGNDNVFLYPPFPNFSGGSYLDPLGVSFSLAGGYDINISGFFFDGADANGPYVDHVGEFITESASPTPEPGSLALLGTSILGGAGLLRRRYKA